MDKVDVIDLGTKYVVSVLVDRKVIGDVMDVKLVALREAVKTIQREIIRYESGNR